MPFYGEEYNGKVWNGKNWENIPDSPNKVMKSLFSTIEYLNQLESKNCHPDGCFKCPMCWLPHYIISNYDLLCDGCMVLTLNHGEDFMKERIKDHNINQRMYFEGKLPSSSDFSKMMQIRREYRNLHESKMLENHIAIRASQKYYLV